MRLQTAISQAGITSRRKAVELIEKGLVEVNGKAVREKGFNIDSQQDIISVKGKRLTFESKNVYLLFNKPKNVVTTVSDERSRKTVMNFLPRMKERVYPVGRLDKDTTGLLLFTNDGELAYRLTHPKFGIDKVYYVQIRGKLSPVTAAKLKKGIFIDGKKTLPASVRILKSSNKLTVLTIKLHEGRKRQVRKMFKKLGHSVLRLKRIAFGSLTLGDLKEGQCRKLRAEEIACLVR